MPKDKDGHLVLECTKVPDDTLVISPFGAGGVFINANSPMMSGTKDVEDAFVSALFTKDQVIEMRDYLNECLKRDNQEEEKEI